MQLSTERKNAVLTDVARLLDERRADILVANERDCAAFPDPSDRAMYDRLVVTDKKVDGMIGAVNAVLAQADPVDQLLSSTTRPNGLRVENRSVAFGTILIIYESRPDVTVEAAVLAFKAGNRILLKGGKEAVETNRVLVECWSDALRQNRCSTDWVRLLTLDRAATQELLRNPSEPIDLIVPRGGDGLIRFVKQHATCAVLVSGRGNNFCYVAPDAEWEQATRVILNAKTDKISACNALDKVLLDASLPDLPSRLSQLSRKLAEAGVEVLHGPRAAKHINSATVPEELPWDEEFLAMRILVEVCDDQTEAVQLINAHSGGHSATICTADDALARRFMSAVDCAAVYHNASTRFTDGGELGAGAELAISTDKLHHRGPLGLAQLVTNKYFVYGSGQVR